MNNPLGVSPNKGIREPHCTELVVGLIPTEVKRFFLYLVWFPYSLIRANAQWVIHGFN